MTSNVKRNLVTASLLCLGITACGQTEPNMLLQPAKIEIQIDENSSSNTAASKAQIQAYLNLVNRYFADLLAIEPIYATFVGVNTYNHEFGDYLSDDYLKNRHQLNKSYLNQLKKIDRQQLPVNLRLSYDLFAYDRELALAEERFPQRFIPINQFYSKVMTTVQLGSGESAQPFETFRDYQNWQMRVDGFVDWIDLAIMRMKEGMASKVVLPRVLVEKLLPQLQAQITDSAEQSIFYQPIHNMPADFSDEQKQQLTVEYEQMINNKIIPAINKLHHFMAEEYLARSRGSDGWWALPNGKLWYQYLANHHTTTNLSVDDIHRIGLDEVNRILTEMNQVKAKVGFEGDLEHFFQELSSNEQYFFANKQDLINGYGQLKNQINQKLADYFNIQPKADYIVKAVEAFREKSAAGASYQSPAVDGSRPGIFYINTYNLKAQPKWGLTTLSLHEAAPGHHFQIAIKQELTDIPAFQRFSGYTAFEEGWALYAEYLGVEMGLFTDPYQYFGKLSDEMLRAMRLVVDTGIHAKGWSREHAIQYMKNNSPLAESDIIAEVERYIAIPGQALSYKIGQLKILELRARAEQALGRQFDIKSFHDQLLTSGSLPMAVMENKINDWIKSNVSQMTQ